MRTTVTRAVLGLVLMGSVQVAEGQLSPRVIAIGDSTTFGIGLDLQEQRWTSVLADQSGAFVQSLSRSGWTARDLAPVAVGFFNSYIWWPVRGSTIVVLHLGTNDWGIPRTLVEFRTDYRAIVNALVGTQLYCVTPTVRFQEIWCGTCGFAYAELEEFRQVIREECPGPVIEGPVAVPWGNGNFAGLIHPSAQGHALLANALFQEIFAE